MFLFFACLTQCASTSSIGSPPHVDSKWLAPAELDYARISPRISASGFGSSGDSLINLINAAESKFVCFRNSVSFETSTAISRMRARVTTRRFNDRFFIYEVVRADKVGFAQGSQSAKETTKSSVTIVRGTRRNPRTHASTRSAWEIH